MPNCFFRLLSRCYLFWLLLPVSATTMAANKPVVVSIKPLYSLVAHLTEGITQPVLLIKQSATPHHYNLRPSQRRLLAGAGVIIRTGNGMEPYLDKIIRQAGRSAETAPLIITAVEAENIKLLKQRDKHGHNQHSHAANVRNIDPHIWLSGQNAEVISRHISRILASHDPEHAEHYQKNLQQLLAKIRQTTRRIHRQLDTDMPENRPAFISYHDAFQYFEHEYALNHAGTISYDDKAGASLQQLLQIKQIIQQKHIQCLVYQPPRPALVDTLAKQTGVRTYALDPLGSRTEHAAEAWFEIMQQLSMQFSRCLYQH